MVRDLVGAVTGKRDLDLEGLAVRALLDLDRVLHLAGSERLGLQIGDRRVEAGRVAPLDCDDRTTGTTRERIVDCMERLQFRLALRQRIEPTVGRVEMESRKREHDENTGRRDRRDHRMTKDGLEDRAPEAAAVTVVTTESMQERNATLLDSVAQLREDSRKHRERADHRNTDDHHRAYRERHERLVAREEHPRHGDHHGQAGDEHCTTGGGSCSFDRRALASPCRPLFTSATEVEERVVDTDGKPDQQNHLVDRAVHRHELAWNPYQPEGCEHRRQSDENGNDSRNRGTEQRT